MFGLHPIFKLPAVLAALALLTQPLTAHEFKAGDLTIGHPWTRATPKGAKVAGGYVKLSNAGKQADRLIGITAEGIEAVEIHEMAVVDNVMTMREVKGGLEIKPGETVELKPTSFHMMMMGLQGALQGGADDQGDADICACRNRGGRVQGRSMGSQESKGAHDHGEGHKTQ